MAQLVTTTRSRLRATALAGGTLMAMLMAATALVPVQAFAAPVEASTSAARLPDFTDLVSRVKPAVVSITSKMGVEETADETAPMSPFAGPRMPHRGGRGMMEARGSGFLVDANGTIVTNNHVIHNAKSITVTLSDGTTAVAKLVGTDPRTDIAVLKIKTDKPLPYIALGDSKEVRPGEWVVAMGDPFGLGGTVTAGIVSALGRDIGSGPYDDYIQIDAPINQGNSGGPLFSQDGHVIGINSAILSPTGGSVGIGFAIPANVVSQVVAELEKDGHVTRGYLGVESQPVTPSMAAALHVPKSDGTTGGALVAGVEPSSPAADAGLQPGDVITAVNTTQIKRPRDLALAVASVKPGTEATLSVLRDGAAKNVSVKLATLKTDQAEQPDAPSKGGIGLALAPLTPELRGQIGAPAKTKGAVVAGVRAGSAAEQAGLREGDVVVGVGNKPVASPEEAAHAIGDALKASDKGDHELALRVMRDGHMAFVAVDISGAGQASNSDDSDAG
jgi:serine protease Do